MITLLVLLSSALLCKRLMSCSDPGETCFLLYYGTVNSYVVTAPFGIRNRGIVTQWTAKHLATAH